MPNNDIKKLLSLLPVDKRSAFLDAYNGVFPKNLIVSALDYDYCPQCTESPVPYDSIPDAICISENLLCSYELDSNGNDNWIYERHLTPPASYDPPTYTGGGAHFEGDYTQALGNTTFNYTGGTGFTVAVKFSHLGGNFIVAADPSVGYGGWYITYETSSDVIRFGPGGTTEVNACPAYDGVVICRLDGNYATVFSGGNLWCETHASSNASGAGLRLGTGYWYSSSNHATLHGTIYGLHIWNRCLSNDEVTWLYNNGSFRDLSSYLCVPTGVVVGGAATQTMEIAYTGTGGVVVGGEVQGAVYNETGTGGVVCGGAATEEKLHLYAETGTGGVVVGGAGLNSYGIEASGGVVMGGVAPCALSPLFTTNYTHRQLITIPTGAISADIGKYLFNCAIYAHQNDCVAYTLADDLMDSEVIKYANGIAHVMVKTPIDASTNNQFYIYYGYGVLNP